MHCPDCGFKLTKNMVCPNCSTIPKSIVRNVENSKLSQYDSFEFLRFSSKAMADKAMNSLKGILIGFPTNGTIPRESLRALDSWFLNNQPSLPSYFFDEAIQAIHSSLENNDLESNFLKKVIDYCRRIPYEYQYYHDDTADIQVLHGIIYSIMADGKIEYDELLKIKKWIRFSSDLSTVYPYRELDSLLSGISSFEDVSGEKIDMLKVLFCDMIDISFLPCIDEVEMSHLKKKYSSIGICSFEPKINFTNKVFCFTGASNRFSRKEIADIINTLGGIFNENVIERTDYLIIGNGGNPAWAYSCYGRKVEKAVKLRKANHPILIVREDDFWNAYNLHAEINNSKEMAK